MRNLFLFLSRNYFFILFLLTEAVCFYLIAQNNTYHNAGMLNSANQVVASIYDGVSKVTDYLNLAENNKRLAEENAQLRAMIPASHFDTTVVKSTVSDTLHNQQYSYIEARVINNSTNRRNNYLTLNRGADAGIAPEMGVITGHGIIGIVKEVSAHYSTVISFLNTQSKVSVRFKKNNYNGSMIWDSDNGPTEATVIDIPRHVPFKKGDTLVTTAYSAYYPEGIMVGTVKEFYLDPGSNSYQIILNLSVGFNDVSYVYVVNNLLKAERKKLEDNLKDVSRNN
ncbi:MAG: Cell shape-determining protein MreC precursor [Bacteroidetes bacterium ADurb.Bin141]|nr:MAG: Cell shape-determining protein MreC precursor [Bacteroidetes bacterium ADurb.Bin141]